VIGAVYVDNPFRAAIFEEKDKEFLQAISDLAAIAIDNARQYDARVLAPAVRAARQQAGHGLRCSRAPTAGHVPARGAPRGDDAQLRHRGVLDALAEHAG